MTLSTKSGSSPATDAQRILLVRAYLDEVERICNEEFEGDWEKMPKSRAGLPVRWSHCAKAAKVQSTAAGISKMVEHALHNDELMDEV